VTWDPYLDLETGVLRNRLGITDPAELRRVEASFSGVRVAQLLGNPLPGAYDLDHLRAFHRVVFGDAQRAFLAQLARAAGHPIRWSAMDPQENISAARAAHLHQDTGPLRALLDKIVVSAR
jgi:fido (protein-threonine AMPylation protein)